VEHEIRHAKDVGQVFFLNAGEAILNEALIGLGFDLFAEMLDGADKEAAGAAGGVKKSFSQARIEAGRLV
jgi:hypothetical protein